MAGAPACGRLVRKNEDVPSGTSSFLKRRTVSIDRYRPFALGFFLLDGSVADVFCLAEAQDQGDDKGEEEHQNAAGGTLTEGLGVADAKLDFKHDERPSSADSALEAR